MLDPNTILPTGESKSDILRSKHPSLQNLNHEAEPSSDLVPPPLPNATMFSCIDADFIRYSAKRTNGSAGSSGLDANGSRMIPSVMHLTNVVILLLVLHAVDHSALAPLLACCLIALDKNPEVGPIGVCEVPRL